MKKELEETSLHALWKRSNASGATAFLAILLIVDFVFVALHFARLFGVVVGEQYSVETDRGYAELYQYVKILAFAILFAAVSAEKRALGYAIFALLSVYLFLDDAFRIHEISGVHVASVLGLEPALGLRAQDFGEVIVTSMAAALFLPAIAFFFLRGDDAFRIACRHIVSLLIALVFFGVVVDMIHVGLDLGWKVAFLLGVLEDGGETVVISMLAWYAYLLNAKTVDTGQCTSRAGH